MKKFILVLAASTVLLTGCIDSLTRLSDAKAEKEETARITRLLGVDEDKNGVRDDIDALIGKFTWDPLFKAAYTQYAQTLQASLLTTDKASVLASEKEEIRDLYCFKQLEKVFLKRNPQFQMPNLAENLERILLETFNTGTRISKRSEFDKHSAKIPFAYTNETDTSTSCDIVQT